MGEGEPLFGHMVYFSLKDRSSAACQRLIQDCHRYLSGHPGTVFFAAGGLADTARPVNDRDFDVALQLVFDSRAAHDEYQAADRHQRFIEENKGNWLRVRVFDADVR
jgi:hypothetical protein